MSEDEQTPADSKQSKKDHKIPPLYGVYLLRSLVKKSSFYVGSTPDPYRRLRQHNGELSKGGAWRTRKKGYRPWRMVVYVHGFPSNVNALQFENAWQHSYKTRHIPPDMRRHSGKKNTGSGTTVHEKLFNLRMLLRSESFRRLGLKVAIFDKDIYSIWEKNKFDVSIPDTVSMEINTDDEDDDARMISGGNYDQLRSFIDGILKKEETYKEQSLTVLKDQNKCEICGIRLEPGIDIACFCIRDSCDATFHLDCWSKQMLAEERNEDSLDQVLPIKGRCPVCGEVNFWNMVIRNAVTVRNESIVQ